MLYLSNANVLHNEQLITPPGISACFLIQRGKKKYQLCICSRDE